MRSKLDANNIHQCQIFSHPNNVILNNSNYWFNSMATTTNYGVRRKNVNSYLVPHYHLAVSNIATPPNTRCIGNYTQRCYHHNVYSFTAQKQLCSGEPKKLNRLSAVLYTSIGWVDSLTVCQVLQISIRFSLRTIYFFITKCACLYQYVCVCVCVISCARNIKIYVTNQYLCLNGKAKEMRKNPKWNEGCHSSFVSHTKFLHTHTKKERRTFTVIITALRYVSFAGCSYEGVCMSRAYKLLYLNMAHIIYVKLSNTSRR